MRYVIPHLRQLTDHSEGTYPLAEYAPKQKKHSCGALSLANGSLRNLERIVTITHVLGFHCPAAVETPLPGEPRLWVSS
jgi:hypothetical protein